MVVAPLNKFLKKFGFGASGTEHGWKRSPAMSLAFSLQKSNDRALMTMSQGHRDCVYHLTVFHGVQSDCLFLLNELATKVTSQRTRRGCSLPLKGVDSNFSQLIFNSIITIINA